MRASARVPGIDAWRGGLLAGLGILVHCADLFDPVHNSWAGSVATGSGLFRMEVFFAIAGYLAVGSQDRADAGWLGRRMIQLGVPFLTGWALALPWWNIAIGQSAWNPAVIGHLWFLPVLAACSVLPRMPMPAWLLYPAAIIVMTITIPVVHRMPNEWAVAIVKVPYYALFYFAGQTLVGRAAPPRTWWVPALGLLVAFVAAFVAAPGLFSDPNRPALIKLLTHAAPAIVAPAMMMAVFSSALTMTSAPRAARNLAGAAYTVYLAHLGVIGALFTVLRPRIASDAALFALLCVLTAILTLALHFGAVRRYPIAGFLLNGRPMPRRYTPTGAAL